MFSFLCFQFASHVYCICSNFMHGSQSSVESIHQLRQLYNWGGGGEESEFDQ